MGFQSETMADMDVDASGAKHEEVVHVCHVSVVACQFVILSCIICHLCSNGADASGAKAEEVVHVCHLSFVACQFVILTCVICHLLLAKEGDAWEEMEADAAKAKQRSMYFNETFFTLTHSVASHNYHMSLMHSSTPPSKHIKPINASVLGIPKLVQQRITNHDI